MDYDKVRLRPSQFKSVTSLSIKEFDDLLPIYTERLERLLRYTTRGTIRLNRLEYPDSLSSPEEMLFFTLSYLKLNPLQEQHGASFDMSQESVSRWFRIGEKALNETLQKQGYVPHRDGSSFSDWLKKKRRINVSDCDGEHCFIDGSDRGIQRPKNEVEQTENYSGKHGKHTIKNTYISNELSQVLYLGPTFNGKVHDKKMVEEEKITFPDDTFIWKDLGYQGYLPENVHCFEAYKKPKNGHLTKLQKKENQLIASIRIVAEHAIGGVKKCRIVKEIIRIYNAEIRDRVVETCTALHNYRLAKRGGYKRNELFNPPIAC